MNKLVFLFLVILYVTVSILSFAKSIDIEVQLIVSGIVIMLFGIPHGAIDHILFMEKIKVSHIGFYGSYLFLMCLYLVVWYFFPLIALLAFLLLSAYHFGESQLSSLLATFRFKSHVYVLWGVNLLAALIYYNNTEILDIFNHYTDLNILLPIFQSDVHLIILGISSLSLILLVVWSIATSTLNVEPLLKEVFTLALIHISFLLLPLLIGFTLYFVVLHSLRVMQDEFDYLKSLTKNFTIVAFIKQLVPFTLLSLVGAFGLVIFVHFDILQTSYVLLSIIMISILTLPHALVMYRFYEYNAK